MPQYGHESGRQSTDGNSVIVLKHIDDDNNSTSTPLGIDEVFTGTATDLNGYASLLVTVYSSEASATDGLSLQFSVDGSDWHEADAYTIAAGSFKTYTFQPVQKYYRIIYTNGGVAHGAGDFHLSVQLHSVAPKPSSHRLKDNLSQEDDCTLQKSVVAAIRPDGTVQNVNATAGGNFKVALEEIDETLTSGDGDLIVAVKPAALEIPEGSLTGHRSVNKFGRTTNADASDPTDVWDRANSTNDQAIWLAPTAARIHTIVSTDDNDGKTGAPNSTGAKTVQVYGLKTWDSIETSETITLDGTTGVNTANSYVIIHRIKVLTSGASGPNIGYITATAATDATVTAQINPLEGQTQMAIYGVASTETLYLTQLYSSLERDSPVGAAALVKLLWCFDVENQPTVFQVKHTFSINTGNLPYNHIFNPYNGFSGPGILKIQVNSDGDNSICDAGFDAYRVDN